MEPKKKEQADIGKGEKKGAKESQKEKIKP